MQEGYKLSWGGCWWWSGQQGEIVLHSLYVSHVCYVHNVHIFINSTIVCVLALRSTFWPLQLYTAWYFSIITTDQTDNTLYRSPIRGAAPCSPVWRCMSNCSPLTLELLHFYIDTLGHLCSHLGIPSKKKEKCGKFHIWGGGPDPGIFQISEKKVVFKMHFKPF